MEVTVGGFHLAVGTGLIVLIFSAVLATIMLVRGARRRMSKVSHFPGLLWAKDEAKIVCSDKNLALVTSRLKSDVPHIAVLDVRGLILDASQDTAPFVRSAVTFGEEVYRALKVLSESDAVKGILVRFDTPGGLESGAKLISDGLELCAQKGKITVAYIKHLSASGGVYGMVGAQYIVANHAALIGSIGVRGPRLMQYSDVTAFGKGMFGESVSAKTIKVNHLHAGRGKVLGDPFVKPDPAALKSLKDALKDSHERFLSHVAGHRSLASKDVLRAKGAALFSASAAHALGLVDTPGNEALAVLYLSVRMHVPLDKCRVLCVRFMLGGIWSSVRIHVLALLDGMFGISKRQIGQVLAHHPILLLPLDSWSEH